MQRGAKQRTDSPVKYWSFSKGQFVRRVDENTKGAVSRALGDKSPTPGKIVYEIFTDEVTGQLVDIKIKDGQYGKSFQMVLDITEDENNPDFMAIDFRFDGAGKSLLKKLPNITIEEDIALVCYSIDDTNAKGDPVKKYYAVPYQGEISKNGKIQPAYTRDEPNGFPDLKKIKVKGQDQWDDSDQLEFLEDLITSTAFPGMPGETTSETPNQPTTEKVEEAPAAESAEESDDVPF